MKRCVLAGYAAVAYLGFLGVVAWSVAFLANVKVQPSVDRGPHHAATVAIAVDLLLLGAFALHHSIMARPGAKEILIRVLPRAAERSTYVLAADLLLALVLWQWLPIGGTLWNLTAQPWRGIVWALYLGGWALAIASTFMLDHLDLVGLRQAISREYQPPGFQVRWLYTFVRHPLMSGLLLAFWITPTMTVGHLVFAGAASAYIFVGIHFEERDLGRDLGQDYLDYARRTPAVMPRLRSLRLGPARQGEAAQHGASVTAEEEQAHLR